MRAVFYPKLRPSLLLPVLGYGVMGALIAGLYGVVHDQITYSIYAAVVINGARL